MRQAIVITNPKWEPFTSASDAFKSAGAPAVLVVRGRCKEKKPAKTIAAKTVKKVASALAVLLFCFAANAQEDITAKAGGSTIAGFSTNTSAANGTIGWNIDQIAVFQLSAWGTNAATTGAITLGMDVSDNGTDWTTNSHTLTVTPTGTSTVTSITRVTNTIGGKWLRVNRVASVNASTNSVSFKLTVSLKEN